MPVCSLKCIHAGRLDESDRVSDISSKDPEVLVIRERSIWYSLVVPG
jgi:hypothetical protein